MKKFILLDILELKLEIKDLFKFISSCYKLKDCIMINDIIDTFVLIDIINFTTTIIESNNFTYDKEIIDIRIILVILNVYAKIHAIYDITQGI